MVRHDRPIDHPLESTERVFLRWFSDWFDGDLEFRPAHMLMPGQSSNRSGHRGRSWYVLIADPPSDEIDEAEHAYNVRRELCKGIISIKANILPMCFTNDGEEFVFRLDHVPLEMNYHHCQIEVIRSGKILQRADLDSLPNSDSLARAWKKAKKWFRTQMSSAWTNGDIEYILASEVATGNRKKSN